MMGVFPEVVRTERLPDGENITFLAEVRLKTPDGRVISSAQSIWSSTEHNMKGKELYVIFSMAQTRATGKAFRLAFSWIIKMAGFDPTPAEEVPRDIKPQDPKPTVETVKTEHGTFKKSVAVKGEKPNEANFGPEPATDKEMIIQDEAVLDVSESPEA
jgi:hypothetical protein